MQLPAATYLTTLNNKCPLCGKVLTSSSDGYNIIGYSCAGCFKFSFTIRDSNINSVSFLNQTSGPNHVHVYFSMVAETASLFIFGGGSASKMTKVVVAPADLQNYIASNVNLTAALPTLTQE